MTTRDRPARVPAENGGKDTEGEIIDAFARALRAALDAMAEKGGDQRYEMAVGLVTGPLDQTLLSGTFDLNWLAVSLAKELTRDGDALLRRLASSVAIHRLEYRGVDFP